MNTSLEHLPEHKHNQLREIAGIIVKAVDPEKVILFGSHATGRWVEHRYTEGGITYEYISDYDILVITKSGESRKDYEVQDVIDTRYKDHYEITTDELRLLIERVGKLQAIAEKLCQQKIASFDAE